MMYRMIILKDCCAGYITAADNPEPVILGQLQCFTLWELRVVSDNFHPKNVLGSGGFGKVYKGRLADGSVVAIKRLKEEYSPGGERQFQAEVLCFIFSYIYLLDLSNDSCYLGHNNSMVISPQMYASARFWWFWVYEPICT